MNKMTSVFSSLWLLLLQLPLFAEGENSPPVRADQGIWQTAIMIAIFLVFFYFILFRPEQKRRKSSEEQRNKLKKGDRVVAMGILGTVLRVENNSVILKMYDGSKIEMMKGAISDVLPEGDEETKKSEKNE
jgi:preprotein translocase subunit YajC